MPKNLNINQKKKKKMFFKFSVKVVRYGLKRVSPLLFEVKKKKSGIVFRPKWSYHAILQLPEIKKVKNRPTLLYSTTLPLCRVGNSLIGFSSDLLVFFEQKSDSLMKKSKSLLYFFFHEQPKHIALTVALLQKSVRSESLK